MGLFDHFPYTNVHELNLDWILQLVKALDAKVDSMEEWKAQHEVEYQELKEFMDWINAGNLPDESWTKIYNWLQANAFDIIGDMIKFITVGLNDNGYIVFKYPSQWDELIFRTTGLDITTPLEPEYGHLTISY